MKYCEDCGLELHRDPRARRCLPCAAKAEKREPINVEKDYARALRADPCSYCGRRGRGHLDHIDSLKRGGANDDSNVTTACKSCNSSKKTESLLLFLLRRVAA